MEESVKDDIMDWVSARLVLTGANGIEHVVKGRINDFTIESQQPDSVEIETIGLGGYRQFMPTTIVAAKMDVSIMIEDVKSLFQACNAFPTTGDNKAEEIRDRLYRKLNI